MEERVAVDRTVRQLQQLARLVQVAARVEEVLQREAMLQAFACVLGAEDVPAFKPDPSGLQLALQRLHVTAADAIYVGDTTIDAEAAANAGLRFVAVLSGPTTRSDFEGFATAAILETVGALSDLIGF